MTPKAELVAIRRSAAMLREGQTYGLLREVLIEFVDEVLEVRQLLERLGGDLRVVGQFESGRLSASACNRSCNPLIVTSRCAACDGLRRNNDPPSAVSVPRACTRTWRQAESMNSTPDRSRMIVCCGPRWGSIASRSRSHVATSISPLT